jgi:hypothetical protein
MYCESSLTGILPAQLLDVYVGCAVGVCADEDGRLPEEGQEQDTFLQSPGLPTAKWTQHQRRQLDIQNIQNTTEGKGPPCFTTLTPIMHNFGTLKKP